MSSLNRVRFASVTLGAAFFAVSSVHAQTMSPTFCSHSLHQTGPSNEVRESWPIVVRNAFNADGTGYDGLSADVLFPVQLDGGALCFESAPVKDLIRLPNGKITGVVQLTNRNHNALPFVRIPIAPEMVVDWEYAPDYGAPQYGHYYDRNQSLARWGYTLQPTPIPKGWD